MSELNRPVTPGPWRSWEEAPGSGSRVMVIDPWHIRLVCDTIPQAEQDARAIADLPAWIEAHDALRSALLEANGWLRDAEARAEKAEAAISNVWDYCETTYRMRKDDTSHGLSMGTVIASEDVLVILRRHGYGPAE